MNAGFQSFVRSTFMDRELLLADILANYDLPPTVKSRVTLEFKRPDTMTLTELQGLWLELQE